MSSTRPTPRDPAAAELAPAAPALTPALTAGSDRYVLEREVGRGGMGRVFVARDLRLQRQVAIKVLLDPASPRAQRFQREVLLAARLQHPGIVAVYDSGFWPTGEPYLVMRLVLGRSLARALEDSETLPDRLALLPHLIAAADAVAYAHDQRIVHRDLKPSNVILGAFGETVVVDWGLAKDLSAAGPDGTADTDGVPGGGPAPGPGMTGAGAVLGTPGYMSPEQAAGQAVDARADVYALGAILAQVLTGEPPPARPGSSGTASHTSASALQVVAPKPRAPADLLAIMAKALARDPQARYPTAFELAEDLKRFQTAELVAARPYSLATRTVRWGARHPVTTALLLATVATVLALLGR
jgi:serine/threonine protein kinase